ncbi:hypothetical protein OnM2_023081 [Erysiphe neolycopersici]|uniref:DUF4219 domain-containing protein n=1 Tax=Erysiphe neolycopersici TaxID=212602 RepID=A0A420I227_9PEZI|nr:hypothetical protein OnM2_023081 [Erysiphe neolycopersici]
MNTEKSQFKKLQGSDNYSIWAIRMEAILRKESINDIIETDVVTQEVNSSALASIQLCIDDGPLLQIKHLKRAHDVWKSLENLYCSTGFSSEFILCREFFDTNLSKFNSMEQYLNRVKQLSDDLKAKDMELPRQILFAWVLNNLTPVYRSLVSNITQSLRNNKDAFTIESLFANLVWRHCLYMPEIGINIISQSEMQGDHYTIFHKNQVVIKTKANFIIATGNKINNLYHIDVDEVIHHDQVLNVTDDIANKSEKDRTTDLAKQDTETHKNISIDLEDLHTRMEH